MNGLHETASIERWDKMRDDEDLYDVLGVPPTASPQQVLHAYRRLARCLHPDVNTEPHAADRFARVTHAYRVLSDPQQRARYDASRRQASSPGPRSAAPPDAVWIGAATFTAAGSFGPGPSTGWVFSVNRGRVSRAGARVPRPPRGRCEVPLALAYCGGAAVAEVPGLGAMVVEVPPGVTDGERLRLPARALETDAAQPPHCEIDVVIRISTPAGHKVQGRDVHLDLPIAPWEGALGTVLELRMPTGPVQLTIPSGTSSGTVIRVPGRGLPDHRGSGGGLCAHLRIVVPADLSPTERELFSQLAESSRFAPRDAARLVPT